VEPYQATLSWLTDLLGSLARHPHFKLKKLSFTLATFLMDIDFENDYWGALDLALSNLSESLTTSGLELLEFFLMRRLRGSSLWVEQKRQEIYSGCVSTCWFRGGDIIHRFVVLVDLINWRVINQCPISLGWDDRRTSMTWFDMTRPNKRTD
jgi:hypothetical protein